MIRADMVAVLHLECFTYLFYVKLQDTWNSSGLKTMKYEMKPLMWHHNYKLMITIKTNEVTGKLMHCICVTSELSNMPRETNLCNVKQICIVP